MKHFAAESLGQPAERLRLCVLGTPIDVVSSAEVVERVSGWAQRHESRYVCICNAHSVVTAGGEAGFKAAVEGADLATPDGAPVAWMLRKLGARGQERVTGPDLMLAYCERAAQTGEAMYLYGSTPGTLQALQRNLALRWPLLRIVGTDSPPFRALTPEEDDEAVQRINASGANVVWVSLGCPKQEAWMAAHRGRVQAVMLGVGAAFDFHAGTVARAPLWMREHGLEWLHRLASEPRRLWRRYLVTNTKFMIGAVWQLMGRTGRSSRA